MKVPGRSFPTLVAVLAAAAVFVPVGGAESRDVAAFQDTASLRDEVSPTLYVTYAVNCTFTITNDSGASVSSIAPGGYNVEITTPVQFNEETDRMGLADSDFSDCKGHAQFQLTGPGVSIATTLDDGSNDHALFSAAFLPSSTYVAQDNNQPAVASRTITTLSGGTPTSPTISTSTGTTTSTTTPSTSVIGSQVPKTVKLLGTLDASVSSTGAPALTFKGKAVGRLTAGRYTVSVVDRSTTSGFLLQEIRKSATTVTGVAFVGKRSLTVDLTAGQWFFYPTFVGKKSYFIVVT
jgi:hypothetical protein